MLMATYRAVADALNLTVYKNGQKVQTIERTGYEEYSRMESLLRAYGYETVGGWSSTRIDGQILRSIDLKLTGGA